MSLPPREVMLLVQIAERAVGVLAVPEEERVVARASIAAVIAVVHRDVVPLDLDLLLAAPDLDLVHDLVGIRKHLDLKAHKLRDGFLPRCAKM